MITVFLTRLYSVYCIVIYLFTYIYFKYLIFIYLIYLLIYNDSNNKDIRRNVMILILLNSSSVTFPLTIFRKTIIITFITFKSLFPRHERIVNVNRTAIILFEISCIIFEPMLWCWYCKSYCCVSTAKMQIFQNVQKTIIIACFWPDPSDPVMIWLCLNNLWPQTQLLCSFTPFCLSLPNFPSSCFSSNCSHFLSKHHSLCLYTSSLPADDGAHGLNSISFCRPHWCSQSRCSKMSSWYSSSRQTRLSPTWPPTHSQA